MGAVKTVYVLFCFHERLSSHLHVIAQCISIYRVCGESEATFEGTRIRAKQKENTGRLHHFSQHAAVLDNP